MLKRDSNTLRQISDANFKRICDCLNRKERGILDATLNAAQECPVNIGFGGKGFLRQLALKPHFPNPLSELFRNIMPH